MRDSPLYWFNTVKATLTDPKGVGCIQSKEDQCLFYHPTMKAIVLLYVENNEYRGIGVDIRNIQTNIENKYEYQSHNLVIVVSCPN